MASLKLRHLASVALLLALLAACSDMERLSRENPSEPDYQDTIEEEEDVEKEMR